MVYALLRDEMALDNGIHALQLRIMTPDEEVRQKKKNSDAGAGASQDAGRQPSPADET